MHMGAHLTAARGPRAAAFNRGAIPPPGARVPRVRALRPSMVREASRVARALARACSNAAHMTHADRSETDIHCSPRTQSQMMSMPSCDAETSLVESPAQ